jgi:hypothetical protein
MSKKKAPTINGVPMACCSQICDDEFMEINFGYKRPKRKCNIIEEITTVEELGRFSEFQLDIPEGLNVNIYFNNVKIYGPIIGSGQLSIK